MIKTLAQLKKTLICGSQYQIVENAFKQYNNGIVRKVTQVQSTNIKGVSGEANTETYLYWQKAKNMRFNQDGTIDFLLGEEMSDEWLIKQQVEQGKDYWLKIKVIS